MYSLSWPAETAYYADCTVRQFTAPGNNIALDFHGDPFVAELAVFFDGNHHMALEAAIQSFLKDNPQTKDVFYTTIPPHPLVDALTGNGLLLGNLRISRKPDVFIGPGNILDTVVASGYMNQHNAFAESRGNVLLIRKGNPKQISTVSDLLSDKITLTCSNPTTEKASFNVYKAALSAMASAAKLDEQRLIEKLSKAGPNTVHSQIIHHREVPTLIASGQADAAIIYYHLALRYSRIFPQIFELMDIGNVLGVNDQLTNPTTQYHIGVVGDGGKWGKQFADFMRSNKAGDLYHQHGLNALPSPSMQLTAR